MKAAFLHLPAPFPAIIERLRERAEAPSGASFNAALANHCRSGGDSVGWHSDNEAGLGNCPIIASLSLGGERRQFRHRETKQTINISGQRVFFRSVRIASKLAWQINSHGALMLSRGTDDVEVIVVGAGAAGLGAAMRLAAALGKNYVLRRLPRLQQLFFESRRRRHMRRTSDDGGPFQGGGQFADAEFERVFFSPPWEREGRGSTP
jgi:hypothetical protein